MATWTELFGAAFADDGRDADRVVLPDEMRELLLDLPHHPGVSRLRAVTFHMETGVELTLDLPAGLSMASGASGPIELGAGVQRDTVQPWRVTPVLGDAGVALSDGADALQYALKHTTLPTTTAPIDAPWPPVVTAREASEVASVRTGSRASPTSLARSAVLAASSWRPRDSTEEA